MIDSGKIRSSLLEYFQSPHTRDLDFNAGGYCGRLSASPTRLRLTGLRSMPSPALIHPWMSHAPQGWKNEHLNNVGTEAEDGKEDRDQQDVRSVDFSMDGKKSTDMSVSEKEKRSACRRP